MYAAIVVSGLFILGWKVSNYFNTKRLEEKYDAKN